MKNNHKEVVKARNLHYLCISKYIIQHSSRCVFILVMKEFLRVLRRFVPPYKKYLALSVVFNILSAILNIFSFATLIPILNILFKTSEAAKPVPYMAWGSAESIGQLVDVIVNNLNYYIQRMIVEWGGNNHPACRGPTVGFHDHAQNPFILLVVGSHHTHTNRCCARHS